MHLKVLEKHKQSVSKVMMRKKTMKVTSVTNKIETKRQYQEQINQSLFFERINQRDKPSENLNKTRKDSHACKQKG